jgi:calcineurin-like phosphoesterase family protein
MTAWFTSDLHFGHQRIIELCNRPFADVDTMNNEMVDRWNDTVAPSDAVYVLGDFAMGQIADTLPIALRLHGVKFLVPGNHDRVFTQRGKSPDERWLKAYADVGFYLLPREIHFGALFEGRHVVASHFPYEGDSRGEDRYLDCRPADDGFTYLLHGHVHDAWQTQGRQFNVGVDVWDFFPVSSYVIEDWIIQQEGVRGDQVGV